MLDVDIEKERIAIGLKQLTSDPFAAKKAGEEGEGDLRKGSVVTCEVVEVKDGGIEVKIAGTDLTAFIKRSELARDRGDQRPERFSVGEKVDARITQFDRARARSRSRSRRSKSPRRRRRSRNTARPTRALRSATFSAPRSRRATRARRRSRRFVARRTREQRPARSDPGGLFCRRLSESRSAVAVAGPALRSSCSALDEEGRRRRAPAGRSPGRWSARPCATTARKSAYCASVIPFARAAAVCEWMQ